MRKDKQILNMTGDFNAKIEKRKKYKRSKREILTLQ